MKNETFEKTRPPEVTEKTTSNQLPSRYTEKEKRGANDCLRFY